MLLAIWKGVLGVIGFALIVIILAGITYGIIFATIAFREYLIEEFDIDIFKRKQ